jgi:hypothetical protein
MEEKMDGIESIFSDPTLLSMILGQTGAAMMGPEQESWQANIGKMVSGLGQSFKMAKALEAQRADERSRWDQLLRLLAGGGMETPASSISHGVPAPAGERAKSGFMSLGTLEKPPVTGFPSYITKLMGGY